MDVVGSFRRAIYTFRDEEVVCKVSSIQKIRSDCIRARRNDLLLSCRAGLQLVMLFDSGVYL